MRKLNAMLTEHKPELWAPDRPIFRSLHEFLNRQASPAQVFRIDAGRMSVIEGDRGLRLAFQPFSFSAMEGRLVDGPVDIHLREVFTRAEIILAGKATTSEDCIMESLGQFWIQATQGASRLELLRPLRCSLPLEKSLANPLAVKLFKGSDKPTVRACHADKYFDWELEPNVSVAIDKAGGARRYGHFELRQLGWGSCAYFLNPRGGRYMLTLRPEAMEYNPRHQAAYLVFDGIDAVARMYPGAHGFTALNIPGKLSATAVLIGMDQGQLYYGQNFIGRISDRLSHVRMRPVARPELVEILSRF